MYSNIKPKFTNRFILPILSKIIKRYMQVNPKNNKSLKNRF